MAENAESIMSQTVSSVDVQQYSCFSALESQLAYKQVVKQLALERSVSKTGRGYDLH